MGDDLAGVEVKPGKPFRQIPHEGTGSQLHLSNVRSSCFVYISAYAFFGFDTLTCSMIASTKTFSLKSATCRRNGAQ
jgi:hypothetical protein